MPRPNIEEATQQNYQHEKSVVNYFISLLFKGLGAEFPATIKAQRYSQ